MTTEEAICNSLRAILKDLPIGARIEESDKLRIASGHLAWFLPGILQEVHANWSRESLDGIYPFVTRKTGEGEIELIGQCVLISDQALCPIHVQLQISLDGDTISWLECKLGEECEHGLIRIPYESNNWVFKRLYAMAEGADAINWFYKVGFGEKRT